MCPQARKLLINGKCFSFSGQPVQYEQNFRGPVKNRGCTDIICCILFLLVILGYIVVGIIAWMYGDPRHVLYPTNSTGWFCGSGPNK
uniref:Choline transporter-like protein 4 n=1 Tax=Amphilophus citrinellus TaxID=61819 RepID=A0A3Q0SNE2_AMPCI